MKKLNLLSMLFSVAIIMSLIVFAACTKEGPQGPAGKDGEDGIDGTDGTATCGVCHDNSETVETVIAQWNNSKHGFGGTNFENRTTCAPCHTSQGFKEALALDSTATLAAIDNPASVNCYTCHKIHDTYAAADWELRVTAPSAFWLTGETVDLGKANLCIKCHQPRTSYQIPDVTNPDGSYQVTSSRFGPHHGSQGSTLTGTAFYMVGTGYMNSSHAGIENACVNCHMASPIGYYAGGHTWIMEDEEEGFNTAGCLDCHTADEAEELVTELHAEIETMMTELGTLLAMEGILNPTAVNAVPGTYTNKVAGAYWNFISIVEDKSGGVHNPKFVKKIIENSIASLQ